jgi:hypothetical protein
MAVCPECQIPVFVAEYPQHFRDHGRASARAWKEQARVWRRAAFLFNFGWAGKHWRIARAERKGRAA